MYERKGYVRAGEQDLGKGHMTVYMKNNCEMTYKREKAGNQNEKEKVDCAVRCRIISGALSLRQWKQQQ